MKNKKIECPVSYFGPASYFVPFWRMPNKLLRPFLEYKIPIKSRPSH